MDFNSDFSCSFINSCGGCHWGDAAYLKQKELKTNLFLSYFPDSLPQFHFIGTNGLRDRGDFIIYKNQFCLYSKETKPGQRELIPINECPQLTPETNGLFSELQKLSWPIQKGSIRFRLGTENSKYKAGVWLDFSNQDIKTLLENKNLLKGLIEKNYYIEVGQKKKQVKQLEDGNLKLMEGELNPWSYSYYEKDRVELYSFVSSFSQTGLRAIKKFSDLLVEELNLINAQSIIEFGSGVGTLTLPSLSFGRRVKCCEIEESSLIGLRKTIEKNMEKYNFIERITFESGNFHKNQRQEFFLNFDTILVNPPRSGIGDFLKSLELMDKGLRPLNIVYLSCFIESMKKDSVFLENIGYQLNKIHLIDQFPQSSHFETLGIWRIK